MRDNLNFPISRLTNLYHVAQIPYSIIHLDLVVQKLLEGGDIEDFVICGD